MSENATSKLPVILVNDPKWRRKLLIAVVLLLTVGFCFLFLLKFQGQVVSTKAIADGMIYTISPEVSATLLDLQVREGSVVEKGAVVAHLNLSNLNRQRQVAEQEVQALRPPDMAEVAQRLKGAEAAELNAVDRVAHARHEEELRKQQLDNWVMAKAQAELRLRGLANQSPTSSTYQKLKADVEATQKHVEQARDAFERASRARAALNQELQRVRYEIQEAKRLASRNRYSNYQMQPVHNVQESIRTSDGALTAPVSGTVLTISAYPGQMVRKGDPIVLIMPKTQGQNEMWINAWFSLDVGKKLSPGTVCQVKKLSSGTVVTGRIDSVLQPAKLPKERDAALNKQNEQDGLLHVPAKIMLDSTGDIVPGDAVECSIKSSLFGI
ncbi:MAG: HlyD family efflux transporter periplasmic adaptor subunit [Desulfovibrionaceae bacterium]|nr:HlyD family efflux transporter periplasmic adaptor subunit [Desulfovibrionaceae bacterium]